MFENVNKDLLAKAMQAKTKEEALAILKEGGVELTDEDLKSIAGGLTDSVINDLCDYLCDYDVCPPDVCSYYGRCPEHVCEQYGL